MALSQLAMDIYQTLRGLVPDQHAIITYGELIEQLGSMPPSSGDLRPRDPRLHEALGEIVSECRMNGYPALSAIVVRKGCGTPGRGYYDVAHPEVANDIARAMIEWGNEVLKVRRSTFPISL